MTRHDRRVRRVRRHPRPLSPRLACPEGRGMCGMRAAATRPSWCQASCPAVGGGIRVQRTARLLPVAMLTALVAPDLFDATARLTADWPTLAGVGAGAGALRFGRSPVVVFLLAIATTA